MLQLQEAAGRETESPEYEWSPKKTVFTRRLEHLSRLRGKRAVRERCDGEFCYFTKHAMQKIRPQLPFRVDMDCLQVTNGQTCPGQVQGSEGEVGETQACLADFSFSPRDWLLTCTPRRSKKVNGWMGVLVVWSGKLRVGKTRSLPLFLPVPEAATNTINTNQLTW